MRSFKLDELIAEAESDSSEVSNHDSFLKDKHVLADHIAWGPWRAGEDATFCATIAIIARRKLYTFQIQTTSDQASSQINIWRQSHVKRVIPSRSDLTGPLKFLSTTNLLTLFAADAVYCVDTSSLLEDDAHLTSHHLDDRWDEVAGVAFNHESSQHPSIHIVSHLSSSTAATTVLSTPLNHTEVSTPPKWQAAITGSKGTFSTQHGLDGQVQERTWGVASSPLGDYVATAITLLPSDSIAHVIPSDRHTIVNITQEASLEYEHVFHSNIGINGIASEVIFSRLQRYLEQHSEAIEPEGVVRMLSPSNELVSTDGDVNIEPSPPLDSDAHNIAKKLRSQVLDPPDMANERNITLARLALGLDSTGARLSSRIIQGLIAEVTRFDNHFYQGGELSARIRQTYNILNSKLSRHIQYSEPHTNENGGSERCRICKETILFESVNWGRCASGHQFSRCALTFLAIQEPGFSKRCGVCGVQLLNEWKVPALVPTVRDSNVQVMDVAMQDDDGLDGGDDRVYQVPGEDSRQISDGKRYMDELPASLARLLFAAFDTCIYCGGKFIA
jgi:hypothetical protein